MHTRARLGNTPSGALSLLQLHSCGAHAAAAAMEAVHTRVKGFTTHLARCHLPTTRLYSCFSADRLPWLRCTCVSDSGKPHLARCHTSTSICHPNPYQEGWAVKVQPGRDRLRSVDVEVRRIRSAIASVVAVHTRARLGNTPSGALSHLQLHSCGAHAAATAKEAVHTRVKWFTTHLARCHLPAARMLLRLFS